MGDGEPLLLNQISLESRGQSRSVELYHGDILSFQRPIDLLVVSAISSDLRTLSADPTLHARGEHTLIGALYSRVGLDVARYSQECAFNLRAALGCWVSDRVPSARFRRILCVEDIGLRRTVEEAIDNVFATIALLDAKSVEVGTVLLPLLGTGGMRLEPEPIMHAVLDSAKRYLPRLTSLERVFFVERDKGKADALNQAMDAVLGRVKVVLPKGERIQGLRQEILRRVDGIAPTVPEAGAKLLTDLRRFVAGEESRSFEIGSVGRRLAEFVARTVVSPRKGRPLMNVIDDLAAHGVAEWVRSYLHMLRVFGNEEAHEKSHENRWPAAITEADLELCFFCILRVLDFWTLLLKRDRPTAP
jgi:hypothetical protein